MAKNIPSIIQSERRCYVTGYEGELDRHHVFKGSRRKLSEESGLWVWLRHDVHMKLHDHCPPYENLENELKRVAQEAFEASVGTREEFRAIFGASYL